MEIKLKTLFLFLCIAGYIIVTKRTQNGISHCKTSKTPTTEHIVIKLDTLKRAQNGAFENDEELIQVIKQRYLLAPPSGPLNLRNIKKEHYSQYAQSFALDKLFKKKRNGFFIECGAATGENLSNTLFFEKSRNWTGLLIEANPILFKTLMQKNRNAYHVNACLSPKRTSGTFDFLPAGELSGIVNVMNEKHRKVFSNNIGYKPSKISVQCFPLFSILQSIPVYHIDLFSLDIEGAELDVLKTIPFDKIYIEWILVEFYTMGAGNSEQHKKDLIKFMKNTGFYSLKRVLKIDLLFKHN